MAAAAERGKKALAASNYAAAIHEFSHAVRESPASPDFCLLRSTAHLRAGHADRALADAEQAVWNAIKRARREALTEAQLARGKALYKLNRFADALFVLEIAKQRDEKHKQAHLWIAKAQLALNALPGDDPNRQPAIKEIPDQPSASTPHPQASTSSGPASQSTTVPSPQPPTVEQTPADKIRHDFYQTADKVIITLLAKGIAQDTIKVEFAERSLSVDFPLEAHGSSYDLHLEPLFGPIDAARSSHNVTRNNVEITLAKAQPGQKWAALESGDAVQGTATADAANQKETQAPDDAAVREAVLHPAPAQKAPCYPTSSKSGPKNWDGIGADEEDDIEGDETNHFFKKLFKTSSPDVQRAMMKSYQESNGTALSTNWEEVSKGPVATVPPDGMEAKPYAK